MNNEMTQVFVYVVFRGLDQYDNMPDAVFIDKDNADKHIENLKSLDKDRDYWYKARKLPLKG
jgi:hypothetical protein